MDDSRAKEAALADAYRSSRAAKEYLARHRGSAARRLVSRREARIVLGLLDAAPAGRGPILDAPCGAGRIAAALRAAGREVAALDASCDMLLTGARAGMLDPARTAAGSVFQLPFRDGVFGAALCIRFLHHLPDAAGRRAVLSELRRVVDGPLVASFWTGPSLQGTRRRVKTALGRRPSLRFAVPRRAVEEDAGTAGWAPQRLRKLFPFVSETAYLLLL